MATNKPISGFTTLPAATLQPGDLAIVVDVSDTSSAPTGTTKNTQVASLLNNPNNGVVTGILTPIQGTAAAGTIVKTALNGMVAQSSGGSSTDFLWNQANGTGLFYLQTGRSVMLGDSVTNRLIGGGTYNPTATLSAGTATITNLRVLNGGTTLANATDMGGRVTWIVTGTGSWTIRITYAQAYTLLPAVSITARDAVLPTLYPYLSGEAFTYFEVSGNNFASTGTYGFSYTVVG